MLNQPKGCRGAKNDPRPWVITLVHDIAREKLFCWKIQANSTPMVNYSSYLYAYRLDGTENGKWLFFDTLKLDFFLKKKE